MIWNRSWQNLVFIDWTLMCSCHLHFQTCAVSCINRHRSETDIIRGCKSVDRQYWRHFSSHFQKKITVVPYYRFTYVGLFWPSECWPWALSSEKSPATRPVCLITRDPEVKSTGVHFTPLELLYQVDDLLDVTVNSNNKPHQHSIWHNVYKYTWMWDHLLLNWGRKHWIVFVFEVISYHMNFLGLTQFCDISLNHIIWYCWQFELANQVYYIISRH